MRSTNISQLLMVIERWRKLITTCHYVGKVAEFSWLKTGDELVEYKEFYKVSYRSPAQMQCTQGVASDKR